MNNIHIFTDSKFSSDKIFYGKSDNGRTKSASITRLDVSDRDQLISNGMLIAPKDSYLLCAYGPLVSNMKTNDIYNAIDFAIENINFDVLYLTIYSDNCSLHSDEYSYENMMFHRTISPHGTECVLISPNGVNRILDLIKAEDGRGYDFYLNSAGEKMLLYTAFPPIMMVDTTKRTSEVQLIKNTVCREIITAEKPLELTKKYTGNMNLFWFFLIVVFILFIAAMLISFGGKTKTLPDVDPGSMVRDPIPMGKQEIGRLMSPYV